MIPLCSLIAILFPGPWLDFQREIRAVDKSWKGLVPTQVTGKARPFNVAWDLCARVNRFSRKDGSVFFPLAGQVGGSHSLWRQSPHFPSLCHWYPWGRRGYCLVLVWEGLSSPLSLPHCLGAVKGLIHVSWVASIDSMEVTLWSLGSGGSDSSCLPLILLCQECSISADWGESRLASWPWIARSDTGQLCSWDVWLGWRLLLESSLV